MQISSVTITSRMRVNSSLCRVTLCRMNNSGLRLPRRYWLAVISIPDGKLGGRGGGRVVVMVGVSYHCQGWLRGISSELRHTSHIHAHTSSSSHDTGDQWRCLSEHTHTQPAYILHTPAAAAAVQLNLLTGWKTTKGPSLWVHAKHSDSWLSRSVWVCVRAIDSAV